MWNLCDAQVLTQVYIDPCSGQVLTVTVPINNGTVTIVYRGQARVVTANDITSGALTAWISMINTTPCPQTTTTTVIITQAVTQAVAQATQQATQQATAQATQAATAAATSSATASATSAATTAASSAVTSAPAPSTPAPAPSSSSSSAPKTETKTETKAEAKEEAKSESKSEEKSESKSEKKSDDKKSSKSSNKAAAKINPIVYSSDLTVLSGRDSPFSAIISLGASQSSLLGNVSYGLTSMIWSTFNQFALSARYTKMGKAIFNYGLTGVYLQGNTIAFATAAVIKPIGKGVTGFNYALTYTGELGNGLMAFYTRPFKVNKYLSMSPDIYVSNSLTKDFGILTGSGFDVSLSKRFKFNCGLKVSLNTNPDVPITYMGMIGTKINL
jgi:hypothetical protein